MADKVIKIKLNVDSGEIEPTLANLRALKKQLKETAAGSEEFTKIKNQINDVEDAVKAAKTGADNFAEIIGALPGPVGELGGKVSGAVNILKQFGGIKLDALKNSFSELGKDVGDVFKGFGQLTGITKIYAIVNNALSKSFVAVGVGEEAAAVGARALSAALAATGITLLIGAVALLVEAYKDWAGGAEKAAAAQKELNERAQKGVEAATNATIAFNKSQEEIGVKRAQAEGKSEADIQKIRENAGKDRIRIAKDNLEKLQAIQGADTSAAADALITAQDDLTKIQYDGQIARNTLDKANKAKNKAITDKELDELAKNQKEIYLSTLSERNKALLIAEDKYQKLHALEVKYKKDTTASDTAYRIEKIAINKKFDEQDLKDKKEADDKLKQANKTAFDEAKSLLDYERANHLLNEDEYQKQLEVLALKYADGETERLNAQTAYITYVNDAKDKALEKDKERAKEQENINKQIVESWIDLGMNIAGTFRQLAGLFEEGSDMAKTFGVISVLINAAATIGKINLDFHDAISSKRKAMSIATDAIAQGTAMFPLNPIVGGALIGAGGASLTASTAGLAVLQANRGLQIASVGITSAAQIAAILNAKKSGAAASSGGNSSGGTDTPKPSYGGALTMATPQITGTEAAAPGSQIAQTIAMSSGKPVRAYVVSGDISSQQALDRKTSRGATFGLG